MEFHQDDSDAHFNKSINELLGGIVEDSGSENSTLNLNSTLNISAGESVLHPHTGCKQPKKKYLQVKDDFHISTISSPAHGRSPGFSKSATSSPIMLKSTIASKSSHTVTSNYTKMPLSPVTSPIAKSASTSKPSSHTMTSKSAMMTLSPVTSPIAKTTKSASSTSEAVHRNITTLSCKHCKKLKKEVQDLRLQLSRLQDDYDQIRTEDDHLCK